MAFFALNCTMEMDPNALDRQEEIEALLDAKTQSIKDKIALDHHFHYKPLDGNVGVFSNSEGLELATLDLLNQHELQPAHFLTLPKINLETLNAVFELIQLNPKIEVLFIHLFCKKNAKGVLAEILEVQKNHQLNIPLIIQLEGLGAKEATKHHKNAYYDMKLSLKALRDLCLKK